MHSNVRLEHIKKAAADAKQAQAEPSEDDVYVWGSSKPHSKDVVVDFEKGTITSKRQGTININDSLQAIDPRYPTFKPAASAVKPPHLLSLTGNGNPSMHSGLKQQKASEQRQEAVKAKVEAIKQEIETRIEHKKSETRAEINKRWFDLGRLLVIRDELQRKTYAINSILTRPEVLGVSKARLKDHQTDLRKYWVQTDANDFDIRDMYRAINNAEGQVFLLGASGMDMLGVSIDALAV